MSLTLTLERGGGEISGSGTNIELDGTIAGGAIESVEMYGDTQQTTYSGIQLIPFTNQDITLGSVRSYVKGGYLYMDGTSTGEVSGNNNNWKTNFGFTLPAGTYTFSLTDAKTTYYIRRISDQADLASLNPARSSMSFTISESTQVYFSAYYYQKSWDNELIPVSLVVGDNPPTSLEPYVGGTASPNPDYPQEVQTVTGRQVVTITDGGSDSQEYEINLGKNLFDKDNPNTIAAYIQWTTPRVLNYSAGNSSVYIPCEPNATYTISKVADNVFRAGSIEEAPSTGITVYNAEENPTGTSITITTSSKAKYIVVFLRNNASTNSLETILASLQIEKGSTATTYAPYFTPIELCKIGTHQDYIYKSGNDWYLHKEVRHLSLAVSDMDSSSDQYPGWSNISVFNNDIGAGTNGDLARVTSYVSNVTLPNSTSTTETRIAYNTRPPYEIIMMLKGNTTQTQWKSQYPNLTLELYYGILNTPTDTQITNSALIAQLEALNAGETYDGTTIITVASENLAGSLEVTASSNIAKTYTEVEIGSPFTITDVEGKSSNTTLDGNVYVDWAYNKKQYSFDLFNLTPQDYADIRAFYDYQFNNSAFPTITVPELNIDKLPVYMEISSRNIINQCLLTDKLTIKFRETVQP